MLLHRFSKSVYQQRMTLKLVQRYFEIKLCLSLLLFSGPPMPISCRGDEGLFVSAQLSCTLCLYCFGISSTQQLTTWADMSLHLHLLKSSMIHCISLCLLSITLPVLTRVRDLIPFDLLGDVYKLRYLQSRYRRISSG